ncbi:MAG: hypothetical protein LBT59_07235 [Clostridiales bacterium]|jgi:hypothetical protein|nr:hypothetical protein [Clostridiales bacterium]
MRKLFEKVEIGELYDFIDEALDRDESLAKLFLATFVETDYDSAIESLKSEIEAAIDSAQINRRPWEALEIDTEAVSEEIMAHARRGRVRIAFDALEILLDELHELVDEQSEGKITDKIRSCAGLMSDVAYEAEDPDDQRFVFEHCLELAKADMARDYGVRDDFFDICASLVTEENRSDLEAATENLPLSARIEIIRKLEGKQAVDDYIKAHMDEKGVPELAYDEAMAKKDYVAAENLLNTFLETDSKYDKLRDLKRLYSLHERTGSTSKMIETAEKLLFQGEASYYPKLEALLRASGEWEARRKSVNEKRELWLNYYNYMKILESEGDLSMLFEQLKKHPDQIYTYGSLFSNIYREEIQQIFIEAIRSQADCADNRGVYSNIAGKVKTFSEAGYKAEALELIEELKEIHSRKWAFLEELDRVGKELQR